MTHLLRKPTGTTGHVHAITVDTAKTPDSPEWGYVGFDLWRLAPGEEASGTTGDREVILVLVEGRARVAGADRDFGEMGDRMDVFEKTPPHAVYIPRGAAWHAAATTDCTLAVCSAPATADYPATRLGPEGIDMVQRGKNANTRYIHNVAMEDRDVASSLLVTEVFTPAGNWSSYPPHRHDENDFPDMTYLEETYYHRLNPAQGYGHQRVFTEDGSLDVTMSVSSHDVTLVPKGHHPCGAPYGYEMYYLNVMAGPIRKWRFRNHPDHDWIAQRDA
ncbi:5-deoxy-glucuronate isomerase [Sagittula salina]|uniref:5-deoxy-glucuronate isomerase n=1 Tax=Sagittula salina TaxID=2820268 RepID=A0A940MIS3_9RHOB|nr:5-deoxy-glucuronate isomerase [Sagittula salina]MBP0482530.1 5-deoxy-glucuronate isomerase [Sagittula salina]